MLFTLLKNFKNAVFMSSLLSTIFEQNKESFEKTADLFTNNESPQAFIDKTRLRKSFLKKLCLRTNPYLIVEEICVSNYCGTLRKDIFDKVRSREDIL